MQAANFEFELTHAKHDTAHCLAPGLFRSIKKGARKKDKLDVKYKYGEDTLEFSGPEPLGAEDLRVLQGLIAVAAVSDDLGNGGLILNPKQESQIGEQLWLSLEPRWEAEQKNTLVAKTSTSRLLREIGLNPKSGGNFETIREIIERIWKVSVIIDSKGKRWGFRLLSQYASDKVTQQIYVALNHRIAEAILGRRPHTRIEMAEVRALKNDIASIIHQHLCAWINPGEKARATLDTLTRYAFPQEASPPTERKRKARTREALREIGNLPKWEITEYAKAKFCIRRPPTPQTVS